jgi:hypothetical protein
MILPAKNLCQNRIDRLSEAEIGMKSRLYQSDQCGKMQIKYE